MPWNNGVYTRGYPSWSNDAAQNLPISSAKFDTEDNDFATGLNNCLTKDGLNGPSGPMTWGQTAAIPLSFTRGSDGAVASWARTGGSNNPGLQIVLADATGIAINLTTSQQLALAIAGTNVVALSASAITLSQATTIASGGLTVSGGNSTLTGSGGTALTINGATSQWSEIIRGNSTAGQSLGLLLNAGTNASDLAIEINNQANTLGFFSITGAGATALGTTGSGGALSITASGAGTWAAPGASAPALVINSALNNFSLKLLGPSTASESFGLYIGAGTNSSDYPFLIQNQAASSTFMQVFGDGEALVLQAPAATQQASPLWQIGYADMPLNAQTASYQLVFTDRSKIAQFSGAGPYTLTIPANASVGFPVGTVIMVNNLTSANLTIAITSDTLQWQPSLTTGNRTLASGGIATLYKRASTTWNIWGFSLT